MAHNLLLRRSNKTSTPAACAHSLKLRVLCLGFLQDGDVGVGVFPEGEEIFVGGAGVALVAREYVGASKLQVRQCADGVANHNPTMLEDFLELPNGFPTLARRQIGLATHIGRVEVGRS